MKDIFSKYSREARLYPTAIGLIPFFILQYYFLSDLIPQEAYSVLIFGNATLAAIMLYLVSEFFVRYPSKILEDRIFNKKRNFPTTKFLLFSDSEYSGEFETKFRLKVKNDFSIDLSDSVAESLDEEEARKKIKEAVGLVIKRVGHGDLVLKHNISYGFFRNLWGASWVGIVFATTLSITAYVYQYEYAYLSLLILIPYILYVTFGNRTIKYFGEAYARKLIQEYMELK